MFPFPGKLLSYQRREACQYTDDRKEGEECGRENTCRCQSSVVTVSSLLLLTHPLPSTQLDLSETHLTVEYLVESHLESKFVHLSYQAAHGLAPDSCFLLALCAPSSHRPPSLPRLWPLFLLVP